MKRNSPPQSYEEVVERVKENKEVYAEELAENMANMVLQEIQFAGFILDSDDMPCVASIQLIHEAIRAAVLRLGGVEHPLQDYAEELYLDEGVICDEEISIDTDEKLE